MAGLPSIGDDAQAGKGETGAAAIGSSADQSGIKRRGAAGHDVGLLQFRNIAAVAGHADASSEQWLQIDSGRRCHE
jgi:hypothetical protein